jgi:hypothetical protein
MVLVSVYLTNDADAPASVVPGKIGTSNFMVNMGKSVAFSSHAEVQLNCEDDKNTGFLPAEITTLPSL